eukprot:8648041-Pyramimonas_sp.AAC.1
MAATDQVQLGEHHRQHQGSDVSVKRANHRFQPGRRASGKPWSVVKRRKSSVRKFGEIQHGFSIG